MQLQIRIYRVDVEHDELSRCDCDLIFIHRPHDSRLSFIIGRFVCLFSTAPRSPSNPSCG
ncbi:Uncharacterized protein APZ42_002411 [Daphnia magna]|uniref:Uncharacterized protein n=1 Tax=Daphnia magna TaxID=35525 RepID=A0A164IA22_9CRUS|nr:Uncharacterized protein APZ42_002411 [Daphnia magna]